MSRKTQTKEKKSNSSTAAEEGVVAKASGARTSSMDSPDKIERIRDLILGPHLRDISQQFLAVTKDITRLEGELNRVTEEFRTKVQQLQQGQQDMEKRLSTQFAETISEKDEQVTSLDQRLSGQISELDKQITVRLQELVHELRDLEMNNRSELRQTVDEMNHAKMDRFSLGELFSQLGDGLKADRPEDEVTSLLNELQEEIG